MTHLTRLDPSQYRRTPWKNGGGVTVDIAEQDDVWRFGRTPIAASGPFSDYAGFDRVQVLVGGQRPGAGHAGRRDRRAHAVQARALHRRDPHRQPARSRTGRGREPDRRARQGAHRHRRCSKQAATLIARERARTSPMPPMAPATLEVDGHELSPGRRSRLAHRGGGPTMIAGTAAHSGRQHHLSWRSVLCGSRLSAPAASEADMARRWPRRAPTSPSSRAARISRP